MGERFSKTFFLFAEPSFIEGLARIFDFSGTLNVYNESETEIEADFMALKNDWVEIGKDIKTAIKEYESRSAIAIK